MDSQHINNIYTDYKLYKRTHALWSRAIDDPAPRLPFYKNPKAAQSSVS